MPNVYNVVDDYGAVGDGSTNDTSAIQAAIDAAEAAPGGMVLFPALNYSIAQLTVTDSCSLLFATGTTITCRTGTSDANIVVSGNNVTIQGVATFVGGGFTTNAVRFTSCNRGRLIGPMTIGGYTGNAVLTFLAHDLLIDGLIVTDQLALITNGGRRMTIRNIHGTYTTGTLSAVAVEIMGNQTGEPPMNTALENINLIATGGTQSTTAMTVAPIPSIIEATNITVRNCHVEGWDHDAYNFIHINGLTLENVNHTNCDALFIMAKKVRATGCVARGSEGSGFSIGDPAEAETIEDVVLVNCQSYGSGRGLSANGERDRAGFVIVGNTSGPCTIDGVMFVGCSASDDGTGNQLYGLSVYQHCSRVRAYACDFSGNATADTYVGTTGLSDLQIAERGGAWLNAKDFGCKGDSVFTQDGAITSGARVLTCTSSDPFVSTDAAVNVTSVGSGGTNSTNNSATITGGAGGAAVLYDVVANALANVRVTNRGSGMTTPTISFPQVANATATLNLIAGSLGGLFVEVPGADTGGNVLATRISARFAADTVHLDTTAGTTVSSATVCVHRTDESAAFLTFTTQAAYQSKLQGQAAVLYFPAGCYSGKIFLDSRTDYLVMGDGPATTISWIGSLAEESVVTITACQRVNIRDMRIFGGNTGIRVSADSRATFSNLFIEGQKQGSEFAVSGNITRSGTTATCNTTAAHGLSNGDIVTLYGSSVYQYNGTFSVTVTDADTFTYTIPNDPGASSAGTILGTLAGDGDAVYINGDNATEIRMENVYGSDYEGFGLDLARTTATDVGGLFLSHVFMGMKSGTSGISGLRCVSTQNAGTNVFLRAVSCVFDNFSSGPSIECIRVKDLTLTDVWTSSNIASRGSAVFADCEGVNLSQCKLDNQSTTGYTLQLDSGKANGLVNFDINHNRLTGNTSGSTAVRLTTSATAGTFAQVNTLGNVLLGAPIFSNVLTGQGDGGRSAQLPSIFLAANLTTVTVHVSQTSYFVYFGKAPPNLASVQIRYRVTTAYTGGTTWGEVGIYTGAVPVNAGAATLTRRGTANFTNSVALGTTTVTVTNVNAGDDIWLCIASSGTTPAQYRAGLADDLQTGMYQSIATTRPSTAAATLTTAAAAATLAVPWLAAKFVLP